MRRLAALALATALPAAVDARPLHPPEGGLALRPGPLPGHAPARTGAGAGARAGAPALPDRPIDVLAYDLALGLDLDGGWLSGTASVSVRLLGAASEVELDLAGLTVTAVEEAGAPLAFHHAGHVLTITLSEAGATGEVHRLTIAYEGVPSLDDSRLGMHLVPRGSGGDDDVVWTITEPDGSKRWFPCNDTPADKATLRLSVTVPEEGEDTWVVASNGIVTDEDDGILRLRGGGVVPARVTTWEETHPIAPYLVALAAAEYVAFAPDDDGGATVPIALYARSAFQGSARVQWGDIGAQIVAMETLFGPYPFDKYGVVEAPMPFAAMEHQTITLWETQLFATDVDYGAVGAHELTHHWFGDLVTPASWEDIWLNEGFASYGEALWAEAEEGPAGLARAMDGIHATYLAYHGYDDDTAVWDPTELFGVTSYDKGASVLHLLRRVMGDEAFFDAINRYLDDHAYGNVTTEDLIAACEAVYGGDLSWFFEPWIYTADAPFPRLTVGWEAGPDGATVGVAMAASDAAFTFPLPVRLTLRDGTITDFDLWVEPGDARRYRVVTDQRVDEVAVDPDHWVLASVSLADGAPGTDCEIPEACEDGESCQDAVPGAPCASPDVEACGGCASAPGARGGGALLFLTLAGLRARRRRAH